MRTLQMVTPEQDHIQELTKINPFGQKQGINSSRPGKTMITLPRLVRNITALVPKEGEHTALVPKERKPEQDLITRPT
jgi:hypothetical protein